MKKTLLIIFFLFCLSAFSLDIEGIKFSDTMKIEGRTFFLNGAGLRIKKIAFVGVKVYAAALYLEKKERSAEKILDENSAKCLLMKFVHSSVSKDKLVEAFEEGFKNNNPSLTDKLRPQIDKFLSFWSEMKEGDEAEIIYIPIIGTKTVIKGKEMGTIEGGDFSKLLFSVWLGENPPNKELKDGLLGK
ncbi:MAG: chalcone isomerase family protein [Acidobacteriota bacterium]